MIYLAVGVAVVVVVIVALWPRRKPELHRDR